MHDNVFGNMMVINMPGMDNPRYDPNSMFGRLFLISGLPRKIPGIIYTGNHKIEQLKLLKHNFFDIDYINKKGLHIYLWEPLCIYRSNFEGYNQGFYYEFDNNILDDEYRAYELDSILEYVKQHNLTNVTVHTCDYQVAKYLSYYTKHMRLVCDDLFLKTHVVFDNILKEDFTIERKFLCINWRYTKVRHLLMLYLMDKSGYYSWYFNTPYSSFQNNLWFNVKNRLKNTNLKIYETLVNNVEKLNEVSPLVLDVLPETAKTNNDSGESNVWPDDIKNIPQDNRLSTDIQPYYFKSFVVVVGETRFAQPTGNFSEKTFYAMKYRKPFILAAPPYTLQYLRKQGFKTFSDFWDESYDEIEDHTERLLAIFKLIDSINEKSIEELNEMYSKMKDVVEHNFKTLIYYTYDLSLQKVTT